MYSPPKPAFSAARQCAAALILSCFIPTAMAQNSNPAKASEASVLARGPEGTTISVDDLISELQRAPEATRQAMISRPGALEQLANNLLVRRVLAKEAERDGLANEPVIAATVAIARDRVLSDARLNRMDAQNAPSDAALDAYARNLYQASGTRFDKPAQTRASHILLPNTGTESLAKAQALLKQLRAGDSFEELAKANSTDTGSGARGGDLGFFGAGQMVRPFEDAVNALAKPGDLSEPVESQFGYHIIRLEERKAVARQPYEEVRQQLLEEARTAILNNSRVKKVESLNKDLVFDKEAIEALSKAAAK